MSLFHSGQRPHGEQKVFEIILSAELGVLSLGFPPVSCEPAMCVARSWEERCGAGGEPAPGSRCVGTVPVRCYAELALRQGCEVG